MWTDTSVTQIRRVRARARDADSLASRQRLEAALSRADFRPAGLPPSAILCVRRLRSRLGGTFVQEGLGELARRAVWPARGQVDASAEAVVFEDMRELLSCLGEDWIANRVTSMWWWRELLGAGDLDRLVRSFWMRSIAAVPAALHRLELKGLGTALVTRFTAAEAKALSVALADTFGLASSLRPSLESAPESARPVEMQSQGVAIAPVPPWHASIRGSAESLGTCHQVLLGVALLLIHEPSRVRSGRFAEEVKRWIDADVHGVLLTEATAHPDAELTLVDSPIHLRATLATPRIESLPHLSPEDSSMPAMSSPGLQGKETDPSTKNPEALDPQLQQMRPGFPASASFHEEQLVPVALPGRLTREGPDVRGPLHVKRASEVPEFLEFETAMGGTFYLINVAIHMGYYGDFTMPRTPGIELPIWDFIYLIGAALSERHTEDPLWNHLAALAGRDAEIAPGLEFEPPGGLSLTDWVHQTTAAIRERLHDAIAMETPEHSASLLIRQRARVRVDTGRLAAAFRLSEHPVEIRRAGLDRNPGWVPAAGRYVEYCYE